MRSKTVHLLRTSAETPRREDEPGSGALDDSVGIDEEGARRSLRTFLDYAGRIALILTSPAVRSQRTAALLQQLIHERTGQRPAVHPTLALSVFVEEPHPDYTVYRVTGPFANGEFPSGAPPVSRLQKMYPGVDKNKNEGLDLMRAYFDRDENMLSPYWTADQFAQRAASALEKSIEPLQGTCVAVSHSGVIEPLVARSLNISVLELMDSLNNKRLATLENVEMHYQEGAGFTSASVRDKLFSQRCVE